MTIDASYCYYTNTCTFCQVFENNLTRHYRVREGEKVGGKRKEEQLIRRDGVKSVKKEHYQAAAAAFYPLTLTLAQ